MKRSSIPSAVFRGIEFSAILIRLIGSIVDFESVQKISKNLIFTFTIVFVIWSPKECA